MPCPLLQIDAFCDEPFRGNPAAVCVLDAWPDDAWLQNVAAEMNLSETAFVVRRGDGAWDLRWFTPVLEVPLCGHATLAAAHGLLERGEASDGVRFHTQSGVLTVTPGPDGLTMDFPADRPAACEAPPQLIDAIGARPVACAQGMYFLAELDSAATVRALRPDFGKILATGIGAICVTAAADAAEEAPCDFVSRFFAPVAGIDEDPVTGSAHCMLGPWWQAKLGRDHFVAHQVSRRAGALQVRVAGDRVHITGRAVTVLRGELLAGPPRR